MKSLFVCYTIKPYTHDYNQARHKVQQMCKEKKSEKYMVTVTEKMQIKKSARAAMK